MWPNEVGPEGNRGPRLFDSAGIPDPASLGVAKGVNGYRSGDYVGRFFWTTFDQWEPAKLLPAGTLGSEFCVGAGAHTHYFDGTGTIVGKVIDGTI